MKKRNMLLGAAGVILAGWLVWGNSALEVSEYTLFSARLPKGFDGFRIAQISDLHNAEFGRHNEKLLDKLMQAEPDVIFITGDLVDSRKTDIDIGIAFAEEAAKIAPCYYATGNHEARLEEQGFLPELLEGLQQAGVTVLRNEAVFLERAGEQIRILGVDDPTFQVDYMTGDCRPVMTQALTELMEGEENYSILLSHRPEWFLLYRDFGVDLTFSGHAHGGQFRLPGIGGLIVPNQGFFPQYDAGIFTEKDCSMVVSRGLGPSIIPLRIGNRPELVVVELHREET